ncbi:hypothetical protein MCFN_01312 [Mycoplasmopsis californica]|uniref:Uncharacterized protein n=1 Tax=Mycoplasmopsis californica TaxID=2113 RepID=A0A059XRI8_9BACT|nr:hypothetical protein [Mycoplasmopsis californica]AIA29408.1 hypothetical protein MCFN_01312 [Mycoplasmopsis californica]
MKFSLFTNSKIEADNNLKNTKYYKTAKEYLELLPFYKYLISNGVR